jgi:hypothetical protein
MGDESDAAQNGSPAVLRRVPSTTDAVINSLPDMPEYAVSEHKREVRLGLRHRDSFAVHTRHLGDPNFQRSNPSVVTLLAAMRDNKQQSTSFDGDDFDEEDQEAANCVKNKDWESLLGLGEAGGRFVVLPADVRPDLPRLTLPIVALAADELHEHLEYVKRKKNKLRSVAKGIGSFLGLRKSKKKRIAEEQKKLSALQLAKLLPTTAQIFGVVVIVPYTDAVACGLNIVAAADAGSPMKRPAGLQSDSSQASPSTTTAGTTGSNGVGSPSEPLHAFRLDSGTEAASPSLQSRTDSDESINKRQPPPPPPPPSHANGAAAGSGSESPRPVFNATGVPIPPPPPPPRPQVESDNSTTEGPVGLNLLSTTHRDRPSPRSILKASVIRRESSSGTSTPSGETNGAGALPVPPAQHSTPPGSPALTGPKRKISFADQHGGELEDVHFCEDLHYSVNADHSESDGWEGDEDGKCSIM